MFVPSYYYIKMHQILQRLIQGDGDRPNSS